MTSARFDGLQTALIHDRDQLKSTQDQMTPQRGSFHARANSGRQMDKAQGHVAAVNAYLVSNLYELG